MAVAVFDPTSALAEVHGTATARANRSNHTEIDEIGFDGETPSDGCHLTRFGIRSPTLDAIRAAVRV